jgi:2-polyprenyl-3-methyl-5-hydroxy-6-metoxy-1,4-benzoquinol methylase
MSPEIYSTFEQLISQQPLFSSVLEVGAQANKTDLICMPALQYSAKKIAIGHDCPDAVINDIHYKKMNANDMSYFKDESFDLILCNSMLEHDAYFWKTIAEIHRLLAPNGMLIVGVPIYDGMGLKQLSKERHLIIKLIGKIAKVFRTDALNASTLTLGTHHYPDDFYRFSPSAVSTIFLAGLKNIQSIKVMTPPRIIAYGFKP